MKFDEYCRVLKKNIELFESQFLKAWPTMSDEDISEPEWDAQFMCWLETIPLEEDS